MSKTPNGWQVVRLREIVAHFESGKRPKGGVAGISDGIRSLGGEHLSPHGTLKDVNMRFVPEEFAATLNKVRVHENDILIVKDGATTGKTSLAQREFEGSVINEHLFQVRPEPGILPRYLFYFLWSGHGNREIMKDFRGSAQGGITKALLDVCEVPVAPENEQRRIAAKIESLFARLDKGEEAVREVQKLLTRYRKSVLKSAVTGELTADWRAENPTNENGQIHLDTILASRREKTTGRLKAPATDQRGGMPEIPESWCWASLDALIWDGPTNGVSPKASEDDIGIKSFKLTATTSGYFIIDDNTIKRVDIELVADSKYWLKEGDVLIQRGNTIEYVGTAAVFPGPDAEYIFPDLMMRLRFTDNLVARWATLWINFEFAKRYFRANATGTAGNMPKINGTTLKCLSVPIPPRDEMLACVELVEEKFANALPAQEFCETELKRSASLRQSILKDAFAGRLAPQDPTDEPASALLARIAETETPKKKTRRKVQA